MITGIETAGLLISIIPLLVSAFEHYNETKATLKKFFHKTDCIRRLIEALEEQRIFLLNELEQVLRLAGDCEDASSLDTKTLTKFDLKPELAESLKQELGRSYEAYLRALDRSQEAVLSIARRISGLMNVDDVKLTDLAALAQQQRSSDGRFQFKNRLKVSLSAEDINKQILALDGALRTMARLRRSVREVIESRIDSGSDVSRALTHYVIFARACAEQAHSSLSRSWKSDCHDFHDVWIYLDACRVPRTLTGLTNPFGKSGCWSHWSHIALGGHKAGVRAQLWQNILHVKIETISNPLGLASPALELASGSNAPSECACCVQNLCTELQEAKTQNKSIHLQIDRGHLQSKNGGPAYHSSGPSFQKDQLASLDDVLKRFSELAPRERAAFWTLPRRIELAANLASRSLELSATAWHFSVRNVFFPPEVARIDESGVPEYKAFSTHGNAFHWMTLEEEVTTSKRTNSVQEGMLELGIILLELWNGTPFTAWTSECDALVTPTFAKRSCAAKQWLDATALDMLPFYRGPVTVCVETATSVQFHRASWEDEDIHQLVYQSVIRPLKAGCKQK